MVLKPDAKGAVPHCPVELFDLEGNRFAMMMVPRYEPMPEILFLMCRFFKRRGSGRITVIASVAGSPEFTYEEVTGFAPPFCSGEQRQVPMIAKEMSA